MEIFLFFLFSTIPWCKCYTKDEETFLRAFIEYKKPYHVLVTGDTSILRKKSFVPFVLFQTVKYEELQRLPLAEVPTMVIIPNDIEILEENLHCSSYCFYYPFDNEFECQSYTWVFMESEKLAVKLDEYFEIPYDCEFYYVRQNSNYFEIFEKFGFHFQLRIFLYGTWSQSIGFNVSLDDFYKRRMNTQGLFLLTEEVKDASLYTEKDLVLREIWEGLSGMMNITSFPDSLRPDVYTEESRSLHTDSFAGYMPGYGPGPEPLLVGPLHSLKVFMHVKATSDKTTSWKQFFFPFHWTMWLAIGSWLVVATMVYLLLYLAGFTQGKLPETLFSALEIFCNQGGDNNREKTPVRLTDLATLMTSLVILPVYSSAVLAMIMVMHDDLPFLNLNGLMETEGYKMAGIKDHFSNDLAEMVKGQNFTKFLANEVPNNTAEAYHRLCNEDKFVLMGCNNFVINAQNLSCRVLKIPNAVFSSSTSIKLVHKSPFKHIFNRNLITFHTSGLLQRFSHVIEGEVPATNVATVLSQVQLKQVVLPFWIVIIGVITSFLICIAEMFMRYSCTMEITVNGK